MYMRMSLPFGLENRRQWKNTLPARGSIWKLPNFHSKIQKWKKMKTEIEDASKIQFSKLTNCKTTNKKKQKKDPKRI